VELFLSRALRIIWKLTVKIRKNRAGLAGVSFCAINRNLSYGREIEERPAAKGVWMKAEGKEDERKSRGKRDDRCAGYHGMFFNLGLFGDWIFNTGGKVSSGRH
jgi:hypothetical protein